MSELATGIYFGIGIGIIVGLLLSALLNRDNEDKSCPGYPHHRRNPIHVPYSTHHGYDGTITHDPLPFKCRFCDRILHEIGDEE